MEIIHLVLGKANPERMNGVNKVVYQLACQQAYAGRLVTVWGISKSGDHDYGRRPFPTKLYRAYRNPFQLDVRLVEDVRRIKRRKENVIFHLHGGWIPAWSSISKVLFAEGLPFVLTAHGAYNKIAMSKSMLLKRLFFFLFEKNVLDRAKKVHCVGESEVHGLSDMYKSDKVILQPYGFEPPESTERQSRDNHFIIGFVGRLDVYTKGLDLLLDAFEAFHRYFPKACLWMVGDGKERRVFERLIIDKGLEKYVVMWGPKFGEEKSMLMLQMDVFVQPSRNEGLPAAVLEAAGLGIPCLVSEATNLGSYVRLHDAGRVVPNENVKQITNVLEELYHLKSMRAIQQLGDNAKTMVRECFNWHRIVSAFDSLYNV